MRTQSRFPAVAVGRVLGVSALIAALLAVGCGNGTGNGSPGPPVLGITKTHQGNFTQGQQNAIYTVTVSNAAGAAPTSGTVTVTETVPSGLTLVSMAGTGWTCTVSSTCTRSDALAGGSTYPTITVTVNVLANATSPQLNAVAVSGGGSAAANSTDSTTILTLPTLQIGKSHTGNFTQDQQNAIYTVTVSNAAGAAPTSGTVTVTETVPSGLTLVSMAGTGWTCTVSSTCTRSDALAGGSTYPTITVTVNVLANATSPQLNAVAVSGGGSAAANSTDSTTILTLPTLQIGKSHTGNFTQDQQNAIYTVTVSNAAGAAPTSGTVTVTETVPSGLTLVSMAGMGWNCTVLPTCTRSDALAGGSSYPTIMVTVNVLANATSPQLNAVAVSGGGSATANFVDSTALNSRNLSTTSGSLGIITGTVGGTTDKVYVPLTSQGSVAVLNADSTSQTVPITSIQMPAGYQPYATAASQATLQVVVISYNSPDVQIIDASQDQLIATKTAPVTQPATFSGGSCVICGVLVDPATNQAILDTAQGYLLLDLNAMTFSPFISASPAENFALNPNTQVVLDPSYNYQGNFIGLQTINLADNSVSNFSDSVGVEPDSAAIDFNTNIAIVPDESTTNQHLINMQGAVFSSDSFTAPHTIFPIDFTDCSNEWTMVSVVSASHLLAIGTEGDDCVAVESMPATPIAGAPPIPSTFHWGHMPGTADGASWSNEGQIHGITVFASAVDGNSYALLVDYNQLWVARINLAGLRDAALKVGGGTNEVDPTPFVFFLKTQ